MLQNGVYDFRAKATDNIGEISYSAVASDVIVANGANGATAVFVASPGSPLSGTVSLTASPEVGGATPDHITFEYCPSSADCPANPTRWKTLATVVPRQDSNGNQTATTTLDTRTVGGDGSYDIGVTAEDRTSNPPGDVFQGGAVSNLVVDNTPPTVTLDSPGGSLSGVANQTASAQDAGTGVAAVKFEVSPSGSGNWKTVGVVARQPYSVSFDARQFSDGAYDLRAEAIDGARNSAVSATVSGVTISNPGATHFGGLTITSYVAPASNMRLLGELPGSQHETWAIGVTDAPPPTVNGTPLPYTAQGNGQLVLLNYTDATGWQIIDVLRDHDGSAYRLLGGVAPQFAGAMSSSGEAWIALRQGQGPSSQEAVFHRAPGGRFQLDPGATANLKPLLANGDLTMRLGQTADGTVYGLLESSAPPTTFKPGVPSTNGPIQVAASLAYGQLINGSWTLQGCGRPLCSAGSPLSPLPAGYTAPAGGSSVELISADVTGPGQGWGALVQTRTGGSSLVLGKFDQGTWTFLPSTGFDPFDSTGPFAAGSQESVAAGDTLGVSQLELRADSDGVWLGANVGGAGHAVVARYDTGSGHVVDSWCTDLPRTTFECANPLDLDHPAAVPDFVFDTPQGPVAEALSTSSDSISVYSEGAWASIPTPGYSGGGSGSSVFADPTDGWIIGTNTLARISATPTPDTLASWPEANRNPLLSVALPPGQSTTDTAGALAVGVQGTALHFDPSAGWQVDPTPPRAHHIQLTGVAFAGSARAFAVGQAGTILRWDGKSWTEDPQSVSATTHTLNAVAFGSDAQGWAVGGFGTILHYDGNTWSPEQIDSQDVGANVTSVAVAGSSVYALANGNLMQRSPDGTWQRVPPSELPAPAPATGSLKLVSGLPDGSLAVAGRSVLITKQSGGASLAYSPESFTGIPVALAAFRDPGGEVRAFVSIAPPVQTFNGQLSNDVGGFPAGDGDLILETAGGWNDLSRALSPGSTYAAAGDGVVQPDPVLALAASPDGTHGWAVGGYAGTQAADGVGTNQILSARSTDWFTSAIWRYDAGGSAGAPGIATTPVSLPASPDTVSFAFFSTPLCKVQCAAVPNAQPDVNLSAAAAEISAFAQQPGGPAFAMLGGNARGPSEEGFYERGFGALDIAHLPQLLTRLSGVPTFAAYGPRDAVPTSSDPAEPWANAFANAPAPFGSGATPSGITAEGSGGVTGRVHKYYAFGVTQNGGTLRAIVLDNSSGSLETSAPGQTAWLSGELAQAHSNGLPVVVFAARPLNVNDLGAADDADAVAAQLAAAGVLGVFTTSGGDGSAFATQQDQLVQVPADAAPGAPQIPEYEGATLTYQQPKNNGVLWYDVSVDTAAGKLIVNAIPVISSLALEPLNGLTAARSSTLSFQGIGRRPPGTIATTPADPTFPGYPQYVGIPSSTCSGCIRPSYSFQSSDPVVGDFVVPSAPGSPYPKLTAAGKTTHSSTSGLFCAYNSGTTTVSLTAGLLSAALLVTVQAGGFGPPCGTVPGGTSTNVIRIPGKTIVKSASNAGLANPNAPLGSSAVRTPLPKIAVPPPPPVRAPAQPPAQIPAPKPKPKPKPVQRPPAPIAVAPAPVAPSVLQQAPTLGLPPIVPPLIPPALTPVPPGGATVSAQATARREEKARKHARQSAYVLRPAGTSATDWFFPVVGAVTLLALLLSAEALRRGPGPKPALSELREPVRRGRR
jgi:hypothetical protein